METYYIVRTEDNRCFGCETSEVLAKMPALEEFAGYDFDVLNFMSDEEIESIFEEELSSDYEIREW